MKTTRLLHLLTLLALSTLTTIAENTATNPVPRDAKWVQRHEGFLEITKRGGVELLFLGDSITDGWRNKGSNIWAKYYAPRQAANFGIGGDRTEHVLWRMEHGELDGLKPKAVVLMIGTNNTGKERDSETLRNTPPQIIEGVTAVVNGLRARLPKTKVLLLGVFPRGKPGDLQRAQIAEINAALSKLADGSKITYLDLGEKFLAPDGTVPKDVMPDLLHPNENGYRIWAEAMEPTLAALLK